MPDHQEVIDVATALHALGDLLDDDVPLRAEVRLGLAVMLKHLSDRLREMERKMEMAPTHADLRAVHGLATGLDVAATWRGRGVLDLRVRIAPGPFDESFQVSL